MSDTSKPAAGSSENEFIKDRSDYLRGTLRQGLEDPITGGISADDQQLIKFHGMYQQDDRDLRLERQRQKLEPLHSFMVRVRIPGGICTPAQYLVLDRLAREYGGGSLRLTTRQTFQFHGIAKGNLRPSLQAMHEVLLDTIAACGDVNRNVLCNPNPSQSSIHAQAYPWAVKLSEHLLPKTRAYHEIWLGEERIAGGDSEPMYGKHYLPRKFKIAVAIPPDNDVDVYANDLGFIAVVEGTSLVGFNVSVGGGMGMTHGEKSTYPRVADVIGFCTPNDVLKVAEAVLTTQRDYGDRKSRKHARLKYTIDTHGVEWFKAEVEKRAGFPLSPARPFTFTSNGDRYGWIEGVKGSWHLTLFIQNGRIRDVGDRHLLSALREIAQIHEGDFRMTANQNLIIANVQAKAKKRIDTILRTRGIIDAHAITALRSNSMACVAFPTCSQAMAESERYLPSLLDHLDSIVREVGLADEPITIRMTGCPNGCARPYLAEIALVGKAPGRYNLYLGGGFHGQRLNKLFKENADESEILSVLDPLLRRFASEKNPSEHFGDFVVRIGAVKATQAGKEFHDA